MFRAVIEFRDLEDKHFYQAGDIFPHDGRKIPSERLEALSTRLNKAHKRLIEQVEETIAEEQKPRRRAARAPKN